MSTLRAALVILNWNGKELLERFLPEIVKYTPENIEVIVADNGSTDESVHFLNEHYPDIRIIKLNKNFGFAGGYNEALRQIEADVYILLNSDIEVTKGWVKPCLRMLADHSDIGALQPKIRSLNNKAYFEHAGAGGGFIDILGYPFCRGRIFNTLEKDTAQYDDSCEVFWASGAALFVKAEAFWEAGGFDTRFFAHMEEIDLCWHMQNLGYKIIYCPNSTVYHLGGGSLPKSNPRKTYYNFRNSLWMLAKLMPTVWFYSIITPRLMLDGLAAISFLFQGKVRDCLAVFRAHLSFFRHFPNMRKNKNGHVRKLPDQVFKGSIVWNYYILGKKTYRRLSKSASIAKR